MADEGSSGPDSDLARAGTSRDEWDARFLELTLTIAGWSKDRSRKVGCVIVGPNNEIRATGYNGFPRRVDDRPAERHERPLKYLWTEHAERNAIYNAAYTGISLAGCRIYVPWYPCIDCARAIVQAGIVELIGVEPDWQDDQWGEGFHVARQMFEEAGIAVRFLSGAPPLRA
jgi:dCMP deaminase